MNMDIDQTWRDDEIACVNLIDFGFRISDFGFFCNPAIDDKKVADFIPLVRGIDDAPVPDKRGTHGVAIPPQR
jgi:hypothetical protein